MKRLIQVAGIIDEEEARMLVAAGVHQLGFPLRLPVHREDISDEDAAQIIRSLNPPVSAILITYLSDADEVVDLCGRLGVKTVQLHADIRQRELARLKERAPDISVIKSLVVRTDNLPELLHQMKTLTPWSDGFLTDTHDPVTGADGATGKTHNWLVSRTLVKASMRPVILAGGLRPENVRRAILEVRPAGVDVHTGVEGPDGRKDAERVKAFVAEANLAFALIEQGT